MTEGMLREYNNRVSKVHMRQKIASYMDIDATYLSRLTFSFVKLYYGLNYRTGGYGCLRFYYIVCKLKVITCQLLGVVWLIGNDDDEKKRIFTYCETNRGCLFMSLW